MHEDVRIGGSITMANILIGIGGSGAKCLEAVTHLMAAGLFEDGEEIFSFFIDSDRANGTLNQAKRLIENYQKCADFPVKYKNFFNTKYTENPWIWTPFGNEAKPKFNELFGIIDDNSKESLIFKTLFKGEERSLDLNWGFRGLPAVGSSILAQKVNLRTENPWDKLWAILKSATGEKHKLFLMGSVFGGTGAAGLPTVARLISDNFAEQVHIGALMLLPYFKFQPPENAKIYANSSNFIVDTQAALQYYSHNNVEEWIDKIYLLGDINMSEMPNSSAGGEKQRNSPHFIDLFAGLAAVDFFSSEIPVNAGEIQDNIFRSISRRSERFLTWDDLPKVQNSHSIAKEKLERLCRFAFTYLSIYLPMLKDIKDNNRFYRAPWYIDFLKRKEHDLNDSNEFEKLENIESYCKEFLNWFANIQASVTDQDIQPENQLVNFHIFAEFKVISEDGGKRKRRVVLRGKFNENVMHCNFKTELFDKLFYSPSTSAPKKLSHLWDRMCNTKPNDQSDDHVRDLIYQLFRHCG